MKNNKKGFTLLELLVVVLIIGILAAIALPQYEMSVEKAKAAEALMNMRTIISAVERNILINGTTSIDNRDIYANPENWDIELSGGTWYEGSWGPMFITDNFIYMPAFDGRSLLVNRCNGKCRKANDANDDEFLYTLFECYPSIGFCPITCSCSENSTKCQKICKTLEGLGVENQS